MTAETDNLLRLDKWLWAARFYKSRSLAAAAVSAGRVVVNGERVKPARALHVGDQVQLRRGDEVLTVVVDMLSARRGSASVAAALYTETPASEAARAAAREQRRLQPHTDPGFRPDKRQRRELARIRRLLDDD